MMKKASLILAVVAVLLCLVGWNGYGQVQRSTNRPVWEYKVVGEWYGEDGKPRQSPLDLNEYGAQGWELVQYDPGVRGGGASTAATYIFKRAK